MDRDDDFRRKAEGLFVLAMLLDLAAEAQRHGAHVEFVATPHDPQKCESCPDKSDCPIRAN